ncbi:hypothetical protein SKC41_29375 [Mycobacterium sp. 050128]|uniref:hypothetical protein n=1 Tax=unclassified Mycobacterium TaxID=2642494 RepID=UPI002EDB3CB3
MAFSGVTLSVHYTWRLSEPIREQLRLAHELREELVAIRLAYEADLQAIWSSFPAVAATEERIAHAQAAWTAASESVKASRGQSERGVRRSPAETSAMSALREARQQRRAAITEVRAQAAGPRAVRTAAFNAAQRALYRPYVQERGLFWCTFNDVVAQHAGAVKRLRQQRITRPDATLRHHPFDGSGTIAVQLIRRRGDPPRSPAIVASLDGKYHNYFQLPWIDPEVWNQMSASQQRRAGRVVARFRYGRSADGPMLLVELPVQQHRQLPADADITGARLTIRHTPAGLRATLNVSATVPDPDTRRTGPAVAVHLGWRRGADGIIAATWRSTRALNIPEDLCAVVVAETTRTGRLVVPATLNDAFARADQIRAQRGQATRALQLSLVTWLAEHGPIDDPRTPGGVLDAATVEHWRGAAKFHALARAWAMAPPADAESIAALLLRWQRRDLKLRRGPDLGQRRHAIAARDDLYRRFAAMLASQAKTLVLDDLLLPELTAASVPRPRAAHKGIAAARSVVAPGRLRTLVTTAAKREGCAVREVGRFGLSRIHGDGCGYENPADARYQSATVHCDGCGQDYDQDHAATALMLRRAGAIRHGARASTSIVGP